MRDHVVYRRTGVLIGPSGLSIDPDVGGATSPVGPSGSPAVGGASLLAGSAFTTELVANAAPNRLPPGTRISPALSSNAARPIRATLLNHDMVLLPSRSVPRIGRLQCIGQNEAHWVRGLRVSSP